MQEMSQKLTFFSSFVKEFFPDLTLPQLRFLQIRLGQITIKFTSCNFCFEVLSKDFDLDYQPETK